MALTVTVTFIKGGQPVKWGEAAPELSKVLSKFAFRNFGTASLHKDFVQFTVTTSSQTRKEVVKLISNVSTRWKETSKVKDVVVLREYKSSSYSPPAAEEPSQEQTASSSSTMLPAAAPRPTWEPTAKWLSAAEHHFSPVPMASKQKGIILDVCAPTTRYLHSHHINKHPCLVLFPGLPDSSARLVPSYPGHPDAAQKWSTIPRKLHKLAMIGAVAGYKAALEAGRQMGISDEDYDSWEESEAYVTGGRQALALTRSEAKDKKRRIQIDELKNAKKRKLREENRNKRLLAEQPLLR